MPREKWAALSIVVLCGVLGLFAAIERIPGPTLTVVREPLPKPKITKPTLPEKKVLQLPVPPSESAPAQPLIPAPPQPATKPPSPKPQKAPVTPKKTIAPGTINPNTAGLEEFELLPGIGPKIAQRIIEFRKAEGPFSTADDLILVKGIGPKKMEEIRPFLKF